jgi:hypothetical protein
MGYGLVGLGMNMVFRQSRTGEFVANMLKVEEELDKLSRSGANDGLGVVMTIRFNAAEVKSKPKLEVIK